MSPSGNRLRHEITADDTAFQRTFTRVTRTVERATDVIGVGFVAGTAAAVAGVYALNRAMGEATALANEQVEAETKLAAVLKATEGAAGFTADELKAMAGGLQAVTTVGDEVIIAGQAILATFKEVRGEAFERATMAALDMTTVIDKDLNSAMTQLGKALNDPIRGMTALAKSGVSFTTQQREQIKTLQEAGDMYGAQAVILRELEGEFGGAAAAMRRTYAGAVKSAKNAWGDLLEEIGFVIAKNEDFIGAAESMEQKFIKWTKAIADNQAEITRYVTNLRDLIVGIYDKVRFAIDATIHSMDVFALRAAALGEMDLRDAVMMPEDELRESLLGEYLGESSTRLKTLIGDLKELKAAYQDVAAKEESAWFESTQQAYADELGSLKMRMDLTREQIEAERQLMRERKTSRAVAEIQLAAAESRVKEYVETIKTAAAEPVVQAKPTEQALNDIDSALDEFFGGVELHHAQMLTNIDVDLDEFYSSVELGSRQVISNVDAALDDYFESVEKMAEEAERRDFLGGIARGLEETSKDFVAWGDVGSQMITSVYDTYKNSLSLALKGDFDEIGDLWDNLWDSMVDTVIDAIAEMLAQEGLQQLFEFFGIGGGSGGWSFGGSGSGSGGGIMDTIFNAAGSYVTDAAGEWVSGYFGSGYGGGAGTAMTTGGSGYGGGAGAALESGLGGYASASGGGTAGASGGAGATLESGLGGYSSASGTSTTSTTSTAAGSTATGVALGGVYATIAAVIAHGFMTQKPPAYQSLTEKGITGEDIQATGIGGNLQGVSEETSAMLEDMSVKLQKATEASYDATEGVMYYANTTETKLGETLDYTVYTFNEVTGQWVSSTATFDGMMTQLGGKFGEGTQATVSLVQAQAELIAKEHGLESMSDELAATYLVTTGAASNLQEAISMLAGTASQSAGELIGAANGIAGASHEVSSAHQNIMEYGEPRPRTTRPKESAPGSGGGKSVRWNVKEYGERRYADGGLITGGSGMIDDVFLGYNNGAINVAMGGEYVVNKKSTAKFLPELESINRGDDPATAAKTPPINITVKVTGKDLKSLIDDVIVERNESGVPGDLRVYVS